MTVKSVPDGWMACPRCQSSRTRYRGSQITDVVCGIGGTAVGFWVARQLVPDSSGIVLAIGLFAIVVLALIPRYVCRDCGHRWNMERKPVEKPPA